MKTFKIGSALVFVGSHSELFKQCFASRGGSWFPSSREFELFFALLQLFILSSIVEGKREVNENRAIIKNG